MDGEILVNLWNQRHGDKLILKLDGNIGEDVQKMRKLWKDEGCPKDLLK